MKVTYPHMGYLSAPIRYMMENLNIEVIEPPPITRKTLELGTQHSPEGVCLPYKITMGNFLESLEAGADTLVTLCGAGKCRFGFYGAVQKTVLGKNRDIQFFTLDTEHLLRDLQRLLGKFAPKAGQLVIGRNIALTVHKLRALDAINEAKSFYGARAAVPQKTLDICEYGAGEIANCETFGEVIDTRDTVIDVMRSYEQPASAPPKVAFVGEFYVLLEPYANRWLENELIKQGLEVKKFVYTGNWAYAKVLLQTLGIYNEEKEYLREARPYLNYHVGGDGLKSVGTTAWCASRGFAGVIHLFPFGCMPEVVAQYALKNLCEDYKLPLLTLSVDEHASDTGLFTRLEAFADCLKRKQSLTSE